jgi:hypothetical protein
MTRRERMERRAERRLDWAAGREKKSAAAFEGARKIADNIPLGQPILVGHHSERAARRDQDRIFSGMSKGVESQKMAATHRSKASGIQDQLDRSIFSDDPDAPERLRERIAELEAERDRGKAINKEIKKGPGFEDRLRTAGLELTEKEKGTLLTIARLTPYHCDKKTGLPVFPSYHFTNLGANIRRLKERLETVATLAKRAEAVAATENGILVEVIGTAGDGRTYTRVTFAEKPDRSVLDALKAAGYAWGQSSWVGLTDALPESLR